MEFREIKTSPDKSIQKKEKQRAPHFFSHNSSPEKETFSVLPNALDKGKGLQSPEEEMWLKSIPMGEDGKRAPKIVELASVSTPDHPILPGGMKSMKKLLMGETSQGSDDALRDQAHLHYEQHEYDKAKQLYEDVLANNKWKSGRNPRETAMAMTNLANYLHDAAQLSTGNTLVSTCPSHLRARVRTRSPQDCGSAGKIVPWATVGKLPPCQFLRARRLCQCVSWRTRSFTESTSSRQNAQTGASGRPKR